MLPFSDIKFKDISKSPSLQSRFDVLADKPVNLILLSSMFFEVKLSPDIINPAIKLV